MEVRDELGPRAGMEGGSMTSTTATPRTDRDEIIRAAKAMTAIGRGGITELRGFEATVNGDRRAFTYSGYFNDPEKLADAAESITSAAGVYIIPNDVDLRLNSTSQERDSDKWQGKSSDSRQGHYRPAVPVD